MWPPTRIEGIEDATLVTVGYAHACALEADGAILCWGLGTRGHLGTGDTSSETTPTPVSGITNAAEVTAGDFFTCARLETGTVWCWGVDENGALGDAATHEGADCPGVPCSSVPVQVEGLTGVVAPSDNAGAAPHTCARRAEGELLCWGQNAFFQVDPGFVRAVAQPVRSALSPLD